MKRSIGLLVLILAACLFCSVTAAAAQPAYPGKKQMAGPIREALGHYRGTPTTAEKTGRIASFESPPAEESLPVVKTARDFQVARGQARPTAYIDLARHRMFFDFRYDDDGPGWYVASVRFRLLPPDVGDDEAARVRVYAYGAYYDRAAAPRPLLTVDDPEALSLHAGMIRTAMPGWTGMRDVADPLYVLELDRGGRTLVFDWYLSEYDGMYYGCFVDTENPAVSYDVDGALMQSYGARYANVLDFSCEFVIID